MYLFTDTETTGLPFYGTEHPADAPYQPRMAEIAAILLDAELNEIDRFHYLIKPEGWPLDDERFVKNMDGASKFHGLTFPKLHAEGVPLLEVRADWQRMYQNCQYICGFNVAFDHKIIRGEFRRIGFPIPFRDRQWMDVMKCATDVCKIERKAPGGGYKFPKLSEAVQIMLKREHTKAHTATSDLDATIELFRILHKRGLMVAEDQPEAKK